jgi:hypothetical protein
MPYDHENTCTEAESLDDCGQEDQAENDIMEDEYQLFLANVGPARNGFGVGGIRLGARVAQKPIVVKKDVAETLQERYDVVRLAKVGEHVNCPSCEKEIHESNVQPDLL